VRTDWQEATYYYTNTAPQWQGINNGNWKDVEHTVRKLADKTSLDLEVRTFRVVNSMLFRISIVGISILIFPGGGGGI
jgi:DNA/RNA endonuclease G (NUC1)